ncbi:hypothetical protein HN695_04375 [Candidatus Woesearchaeota archaeon]|jgi:hypothetical protein|nr:hypothetical protein [Candidatus Woesearchaeota archaeon]MBT5272386.1 hypothetical protein [Candidatus Woesearchaeota archaeon]MBT6040997.1 hypothetical protein [Candidatus Woesearchaeota archaeon]MBT6336658.1 hypothetical protein [Candidatus Woesearchaeota archaeon]MBT7927548.1 hypothetical protein [Candidatus Woesearchaeota archaeon]
MEKQEVISTLKVIIAQITETDIVWRLEGSANLSLQGIKTEVNDLDITTNKKGLEIFRELLNKYIIKDFFDTNINSHRLILNINNFEVDINCYNKLELNMFESIKIISIDNLNIPVLPIKESLKFYKIINRKNKISLIEEFLLKINKIN